MTVNLSGSAALDSCHPREGGDPLQPVSPSEFAAAMAAAGLADAAFAVALSGGADSMALTLLAKDYAPRFVALTVDHALRPESAAEAEAMQRWCETHGITHHTLRWQHGAPPTSSIQERARKARYQLMGDYCRAHHIPYVLTAHHRDDQAETLFFRLARGSGFEGLACMAAAKELCEGVTLARPLLAFPKSRLVATLKARGETWIEDPSNSDPKYTRNAIRAALAGEPWSISERAYIFTQHFANIRKLLENILVRNLTKCVSWEKDGSASLHLETFYSLTCGEQIPLLAHLVQRIGGSEHKPRSEKLARLHDEIITRKVTHPRRLGGCMFHPPQDGRMHIAPLALE